MLRAHYLHIQDRQLDMDNQIPSNIQAAVNELKLFSNILAIKNIVTLETFITVTVDWRVTLPSRYCSDGITSLGIKAVESVEWIFPTNYPLGAPIPTLRIDFPTSLPHINPIEKGERISPCISELPLLDLLHSSGLQSILTAMSHWLDNAASGELHCPVQGWEPVRRDHSSGIINVDTFSLRTELNKKYNPARYYKYRYYLNKENDLLLGSIDTPSIGSSNNAISTNNIYLLKNGTRHGVALLLQMSSDKVENTYQPEMISNYSDLRSYALRLGLLEVLDARVKHILSVSGPSNLKRKGKEPIEEFLVIFAVNRPFNVIGTNSKLELLGYRVPFAQDSKKYLPKSTPVFAPQLMRKTCPELLQTVTGTEIDNPKKLMMIGGGSLGSKLTLHLAKTGKYSFEIIDNDYFSSHNNARYGFIADELDSVFGSKVKLLQQELQRLKVQCVPKHDDIFNILSATDKPSKKSGAHYLIDTSASLSVRYMLSHKDNLPARLIHTVMYGNASMGIMAAEGLDRNVRLDDIIAYLDTLSIDNISIKNSMYGGNPSRQMFSEGCSSATTKISDIDISLITAALAKKVDQFTYNGAQTPEAILNIGLVDHDNNMSWTEFYLEPTIIIPRDNDFDWDIRILGHIADEIINESNKNRNIEQGGVLTGKICHLSQTLYVTRIEPAPLKSIRTKNEFILSTEGLDKIYCNIHEQTNGQISFLGTWHSHTSPTPPSITDKSTFKKLNTYYDLPIVMLTYTGGRLVRV